MAAARTGRGVLVFAAATAAVAWALAAVVFRHARQPGLAVSLFGLGLSLGPCLAAYVVSRRERKQAWRKTVLATGGIAILAFSFGGGAVLDLEGFLSLLFLGTMGAAVGHTLATTVVGPLVFGRVLCGWGCWRAMVLEQLPVGEATGRRREGLWRRLPLAGLGLSAGAAGLTTFSLGLHPGGVPGAPPAGLGHVAASVAAYYALAVGLAVALRDRRAFCKYLCPTGQILRWTGRRSLLAIRSEGSACTRCGTCSSVCPMDIDVSGQARLGGRVGGGECILCQRCVESCPAGALGFGRRRRPG
jgi:ferredoxin-type protein NapH